MDFSLFKNLAREWEDHGAADPFFGVLSDPAKRGGKWDADAFFASGQSHVRNLMASLADSGILPAGGACLDFGCGVGRLTQPFCEYFDPVTGVDVATSMIRRARRFNAHGSRCRFVVNRSPDLRQFSDATFDLVHSCIVLQHMPPDIALGYVREFFRIAKPAGVVVFQVPDSLRSAEMSAAALALPDAAFRAEITLAAPLAVLRAGEHAEIVARVRNAGDVNWLAQPPTREAGHIRLANHWLREDGSVAVRDDGRGILTERVAAGESIDVPIVVRAPTEPGVYVLELDLVQELVSWFADKGSSTLKVPVRVESSSVAIATPARPLPAPAPRPSVSVLTQRHDDSFFARLFRRPAPTAKATFPMPVIPRADVEQAVESHGWRVARTFEDEACGPGWNSFTYVCVKGA